MSPADSDRPGAPASIPRRVLRAEQVLLGRTRRVAIALEGSQDPHNVHAVLRSAEALGVQDVHLVAPRGEVAGVAAGVTQRAHQWLSVRRHPDVASAVAVLRDEGRRVWAAANDPDGRPLTGLALEGRVALLFGNETEGLSGRARELADDTFRIDLVGFSGSLNLSVAAAVALWELRREEVASPEAGDLAETEKAALRREWLGRLFAGRSDAEQRVERWCARAGELTAAARARARVTPIDRAREAPGATPEGRG